MVLSKIGGNEFAGCRMAKCRIYTKNFAAAHDLRRSTVALKVGSRRLSSSIRGAVFNGANLSPPFIHSWPRTHLRRFSGFLSKSALMKSFEELSNICSGKEGSFIKIAMKIWSGLSHGTGRF